MPQHTPLSSSVNNEDSTKNNFASADSEGSTETKPVIDSCSTRSNDTESSQVDTLIFDLVYWRDPKVNKTDDQVKQRLETYAKSLQSMAGFQLRSANLCDVDLVNRGSKVGYDLSYADFYRANLTDAHMFKINLKGASLMKAKLCRANLHCANLEDCNLLGADLTQAKLENINWGKYILQEKKAIQAKLQHNYREMKQLYEEAEEVYRSIRKNCEAQGLFETSGYFFHREMIMRRYQMPFWSSLRFFSKLVDLFCGYGQRPLRVVFFSFSVIAMCAIAYFLIGVSDSGQLVKFNWEHSFLENLYGLTDCLYFSVVTFTTLGYGDFTPVGLTRLVAAVEAFTGSFTMALFVVVFVNKILR
ncbi:pentapeptide repeat-containing protein [Zooshikella marina]|uniref:ion channel n=1 Tax=Zooshikella ganghwensis TaxID=202772 RepID=UPI001BB0BCD2|nr:pentapeptide repeat-containing protein [Zooshikella ganghwensis]MBU2704802.1 pentapeptide repeat-containing protein [Zooshikella ganghwensis]